MNYYSQLLCNIFLWCPGFESQTLHILLGNIIIIIMVKNVSVYIDIRFFSFSTCNDNDMFTSYKKKNYSDFSSLLLGQSHLTTRNSHATVTYTFVLTWST